MGKIGFELSNVLVLKMLQIVPQHVCSILFYFQVYDDISVGLNTRRVR